jgi:hypothetical protein
VNADLTALLRAYRAAWVIPDQAWMPPPFSVVSKVDAVTGPFARRGEDAVRQASRPRRCSAPPTPRDVKASWEYSLQDKEKWTLAKDLVLTEDGLKPKDGLAARQEMLHATMKAAMEGDFQLDCRFTFDRNDTTLSITLVGNGQDDLTLSVKPVPNAGKRRVSVDKFPGMQFEFFFDDTNPELHLVLEYRKGSYRLTAGGEKPLASKDATRPRFERIDLGLQGVGLTVRDLHVRSLAPDGGKGKEEK